MPSQAKNFESTVTSKGQITLPVFLREKLGVKTGSKILFEETANGTFQCTVKNTDVRALKNCVSYRGEPVSIEAMNDAIMKRGLDDE